MDRRERIPSKTNTAMIVALRAWLSSWQGNIWTALPAYIAANPGYNAAKLTVSAQPTIQGQFQQPDGTWLSANLPLCLDCPVMFPGGGGFVLTFPLATNDEGLLVFASRCIDSWWQSGGIQTQAELRMHDMSDGFFIPTGGLSQPNVPSALSTTTCQLRSIDGSTYVEVANGKIINIVAPTGLNVNAPVTFQQSVTFLGQVNGQSGGGGTVNFGSASLKTSGDIETGGVDSINSHTHSGVQSGGSDTGPPVGSS